MSDSAVPIATVATPERDWLTGLLALLEPTGDVVHLSRVARCRRYTLRGVPAKRIDVLVDERLSGSAGPPDHRDRVVIQACRKAGRYDGAERVRLSIRAMHSRDARQLPVGALAFGAPGDTPLVLALISDDGEPMWSGTYTPLRADLDGYDLPKIVWWHWCRYYGGGRQGEARHGPLGEHRDDVAALAHCPATWMVRPDGEPMLDDSGRPLPGVTLSEANRAASRALYRLARDLGWRKLTMRERARLGISGSQWVLEETYAAAQARIRDFDLVGDATDRAAGGMGLGLDVRDVELYVRATDMEEE